MKMKLTWKIRLLMAVSFVLMGFVRLCILLLPFKWISPFLGQKNGSTPEQVERRMLVRAAKIGWVVEAMSTKTPWESKCLVRAITAQLMLRAVRTPSTLYLGLAKDQSSHQLLAHAWLRCGPLTLTGADEEKNFKCVAQFASLAGSESA